jgi:hypothetical protein
MVGRQHGVDLPSSCFPAVAQDRRVDALPFAEALSAGAAVSGERIKFLHRPTRKTMKKYLAGAGFSVCGRVFLPLAGASAFGFDKARKIWDETAG